MDRLQNKEFVAPNLPNFSRYKIKSIYWSRTQFFVSSTLFSHLAIFGQFWSFSLERVQNKEFVARNLPTTSRHQIKSIWWSRTHFVVSSTLFSRMAIFGQLQSPICESYLEGKMTKRSFVRKDLRVQECFKNSTYCCLWGLEQSSPMRF